MYKQFSEWSQNGHSKLNIGQYISDYFLQHSYWGLSLKLMGAIAPYNIVICLQNTTTRDIP